MQGLLLYVAKHLYQFLHKYYKYHKKNNVD